MRLAPIALATVLALGFVTAGALLEAPFAPTQDAEAVVCPVTIWDPVTGQRVNPCCPELPVDRECMM